MWFFLKKKGTTSTNWSTGSPNWTWGRTSSLWGWRSTGTGCPGRLWVLPLWRYWRPAWTRSCAACCRRPCFGRRIGLDDPQRSLPTPNILWFCDSVKCRWLTQVYTRQWEPLISLLYSLPGSCLLEAKMQSVSLRSSCPQTTIKTSRSSKNVSGCYKPMTKKSLIQR